MTDSDSGAVSQEEIAHKFVIPERQVKVQQLIKKMDSPGASGDEIYCICRSSDCSTFMIGCDCCNEWYHGSCINLTQEDSISIKHFYCHICRGKDPTLKIKYKHKKKDKDRDRDRERSRIKDKKHFSEKHRSSSKHHSSDKHHSSQKHRDKHDKIKKHKERSKDRPHGEKVREKSLVEKAREKMLLQSSKEKHSTSVMPQAAPEVKKEPPPPQTPPPPPPPPVPSPSPSTPPQSLPSPVSSMQRSPVSSMSELLPSNHTMMSRSAAAVKKSTRRCGDCISCHRTEDCSRCDYCKDMKKFGGPNKIRQKCRLRQCLNFGAKMKANKQAGMEGVERSVTAITENEYTEFVSDSGGNDPEYVYSSPGRQTTPKKERRYDSDYSTPGRKQGKDGKKADKKKKGEQKKSPSRARVSKRRMEEDIEDLLISVDEDEAPRQCHGPTCIELAREGSKYCSDECGMKLATNRIFEILPQRIQQCNATLCVAEENNKLSLETIRNGQLQARQKLVQLDLKHKQLDSLIERAKHAMADQDQENTEGEEENDLSIHCVTCGHEIAQKTALRHMERCFSRFESQTSFGSIYKTRIDLGNMFCDYYNIQAKTYCKRLKVLCPEHSKEAKVLQDEVCGCPLVTNVFTDTGKFCRTQKRQCSKHYCWEKLRRAEIDMEKVRQWMKLDDLFEQERHIRSAMSCRAGVLGLMLHQTIDHDPLRPIKTLKTST